LDLRYWEAEEAGNSRRSFDLNLYRAGMRLSGITPGLTRMWEHFRIEPAQWQPVLKSDSGETLSHLTGGIHRNGEDFFNVYYGCKSIRSSGLRVKSGRNRRQRLSDLGLRGQSHRKESPKSTP